MENKMNKADEVKDLLTILRFKCFSLAMSTGDTEIEDGLAVDIADIENRIVELVEIKPKNNFYRWLIQLFCKSKESTNEDTISRVNRESERILKELK